MAKHLTRCTREREQQVIMCMIKPHLSDHLYNTTISNILEFNTYFLFQSSSTVHCFKLLKHFPH